MSMIYLFSLTAYLDEVQDLSYASIYLMCSLGGRKALSPHWVCAGDPAQMISSGCSFSFAGLKETLSTIRPDVQLKDVDHLLVNYRTTKDVLELANAILSTAKRDFLGAIGFAQPEIAQKDLGHKVVLGTWDEAFSEPRKLGVNQAVIYSGKEELEHKLMDWTSNHPFVLSSLDSKGLEFDDIIVVFDLDRKAWDTTSGRAQSLQMLRELYVAITRGRRKVIILAPKRASAMWHFLMGLGYNFQTTGVGMILREFHTETSPAEWKKKGMEHFEDKQYHHAARCFDASGDVAWSQYAEFRRLLSEGNKGDAESACVRAMEEFAAQMSFAKVVELAVLAERHTCWPSCKTDLIRRALDAEEMELDRDDYIRLSLRCENWSRVTVDDLKNPVMSGIWLATRADKRLSGMLKRAATSELDEISLVVPAIMGDFYRGLNLLDKAVDLYLQAQENESATEIVRSLLDEFDQKGTRKTVATEKTLTYLDYCVTSCLDQSLRSGDNQVKSLLRAIKALRENPNRGVPPCNLLRTVIPDCAKHLRRSVILWSVEYAKADRLCLYYFGATLFLPEITSELTRRFSDRMIEAVKWFLSLNETGLAADFSRKRLREWNNSEILSLVLVLRPSQGDGWEWIYDKIYSSRLTTWCVCVVAGSAWSPLSKNAFLQGLERRAKALGGNIAASSSGKSRKKKGADNVFTAIEQWSIDFLRVDIGMDDQNDGSLTDLFRRISDDNLCIILSNVRLFSGIIDKAELDHGSDQPRQVYRSLFLEADRRKQGMHLLRTAKDVAEIAWLFRAFLSYEIAIYVPPDSTLDMLHLSLTAGLTEVRVRLLHGETTPRRPLHEVIIDQLRQGTLHGARPDNMLDLLILAFESSLCDLAERLYATMKDVISIPSHLLLTCLGHSLRVENFDLAIDMTWRAVATRESAEVNLPKIVELWMESPGIEGLGSSIFGAERTVQSLLETMLVLNPKAKDAQQSMIDFIYGPAVARCVRLGVENHSVFESELRQAVEFQRELEATLATKLIASSAKGPVTKKKKSKSTETKPLPKIDSKIPTAEVSKPKPKMPAAQKNNSKGSKHNNKKKNKRR